MKKKIKEEDFNPYCSVCGTCGFIGCCGIRNFLLNHVVGKTNCDYEELVLSDLIITLNSHRPKDGQFEYLTKCPKCKSFKCSGWHPVKLKNKKK
jgi:hypothetical protein